ncbi:MAG: geranylgeranylglycerol-phosphate geranylgeranyltransferase [Candidatus Nezhaarchaeota archaeon]|nr:geranylgeranylglycerol-phosphate geranylgeranyltransferase [Candidatus Nezhaarchaeota archaeon]
MLKRSSRSIALGLMRIVRPINSLMTGAAVIVGMLIAVKGHLSEALIEEAVLSFVTGSTLSGAAMVVNDYYDREIDLINDPARPIPSGAVKPREALTLASTLVLIGLAASALTCPQCLALSSTAVAVAIGYATKGKSTGIPGNIMVSFCTAIPFIYGGMAVGGIDPSLLLFASIAFTANMGREVTKGIVDVVGDSSMGIRTVAAVYGRVAAAKLASLFFLAAVAMSIAPWLLGFVSVYYLPLVVICDIGFVKSALALVRNPSAENARRVKHEVLLWMLIGLAAFMAGTMLR